MHRIQLTDIRLLRHAFMLAYVLSMAHTLSFQIDKKNKLFVLGKRSFFYNFDAFCLICAIK